MAMTEVKGKFCKLEVGSTPIELPGSNWSISIDGKVIKVPNFRDGRRAVGTLDDATVSFELIYDEDAPPDETGTGNPGIRPGENVTLKAYVNNAATKFLSLPLTIATVTPAVGSQEEVLRYNVTAELHGTITWPVHT